MGSGTIRHQTILNGSDTICVKQIASKSGSSQASRQQKRNIQMTNGITTHLVKALTLFGLWLVCPGVVLAADCFVVGNAVSAPAAPVKPCADSPVPFHDAANPLRAAALNAAPTNGVALNGAKEFPFQPDVQGDPAPLQDKPLQDKWSVTPSKSNIRAAEQRPGLVEAHVPAAPPTTVPDSKR